MGPVKSRVRCRLKERRTSKCSQAAIRHTVFHPYLFGTLICPCSSTPPRHDQSFADLLSSVPVCVCELLLWPHRHCAHPAYKQQHQFWPVCAVGHYGTPVIIYTSRFDIDRYCTLLSAQCCLPELS
jgi:hypothetical protein